MASAAVTRIQQALKAKGFDPGPIDGIWGRSSIAAVKRFQASKNLTVDGIVGPQTTAALFAGATPAAGGAAAPAARPAASLLPWFEEARHLMGTKEVGGRGNNQVILDWAANLEVHYPSDDIPWCGLFVAHCVGSTLQEEPLPANPLGARQWAKFGAPTQPRLGAIMVFWRESRTSGKGHVGFYAGEDASAYQILGGNQSDKVCLTWLGKDRFLEARWPTSAASLMTAAVTRNRHEGLSTNEA